MQNDHIKKLIEENYLRFSNGRHQNVQNQDSNKTIFYHPLGSTLESGWIFQGTIDLWMLQEQDCGQKTQNGLEIGRPECRKEIRMSKLPRKKIIYLIANGTK